MDFPYVIAIVPAHNEGRNIAKTLRSIRSQVNYIIVACDNCTDDTFQVSVSHGADRVINTVNNHARKAGALNQVLEHDINWQIPNLYIMVIDADTQICPGWMAKAKRLIRPYNSMAALRSHDYYNRYDAVGSVFYSDKRNRPTMLELCQHNEWVRYANKIKRDRKVFVLTGTCSLISAQKLLAVHHKYHRFYDENSITEDFAMTIDLKEVGTRMISPLSCVCTTKTMQHYSDLIRQRRRWYLGAISLIFHRKIDRVLLPYLGQQLMLFVAVFAFLLFLGMSFTIYAFGEVQLTWFWTFTFLIFCIERVASIWHESFLDKLFAACMIPELIYSFVLNWAYCLAWVSYLKDVPVYWNHHKS